MSLWVRFHRMGGCRLIIAALAACLPGIAVAQVAAPVLNPTAMLVTTLNPAGLQRSTPSRVSLGWVPTTGLAVVLRRETRALDNSNGTAQERTLDRVAVAWQF